MEPMREGAADSSRSGADETSSTARRHVLVVEDDPYIARLVATELAEAGYDVEQIGDGERGLARFEVGGFDLVVLDVVLPGIDGLELIRRIRRQCRFTPIVMISARAGMSDIVRALELGADEYLTKPFATAELMARIQALFRRIAADRENGSNADSVIRRGPLTMDAVKHEVRLHDERVPLTAKEFDLLHLFASHPGRAFTRGELLSVVWGVEFEGYEHTVNTHINRLRKKLACAGATTELIQTVWGVGYRFTERPD